MDKDQEGGEGERIIREYHESEGMQPYVEAIVVTSRLVDAIDEAIAAARRKKQGHYNELIDAARAVSEVAQGPRIDRLAAALRALDDKS